MPAIPERDGFAFHARTPGDPARRCAAVTPDDGADLPAYAKGLYVGQAGDVRLIPTGAGDGEAVTFKAHPIGYLPVQARRVLSTGTTAAHLLALFD